MERIVWRFIPGYPAVFHQIRLTLTVVQRSIIFPFFRIISNIIECCLQLQIPCIGIVSSEKIAVSVTHIIAIPIINGISFNIGLSGTLVINRQPIFIQNRIDMGLQQTSVICSNRVLLFRISIHRCHTTGLYLIPGNHISIVILRYLDRPHQCFAGFFLRHICHSRVRFYLAVPASV